MDEVETHDWSLVELAQAETEPRGSATDKLVAVYDAGRKAGLSQAVIRRFLREMLRQDCPLTEAQALERLHDYVQGGAGEPD